MNSAMKQKLLDEFETMRLLEKDAYDFYLRASNDPSVISQSVRRCFSNIAEDERHHLGLVEKIMNIIKNCL